MTKEEKKRSQHLSSKKWNAANKDKVKADCKKWRESHKQPFYIVYCIPNEDPPYVGKTNNPRYRMFNHKSKGKDLGEDGKEWFILDVCMTNKEALDSERAFHDQGYGGRRMRGGIARRVVLQIDKHTNEVIAEHESIQQAARSMGCRGGNISDTLSGKNKTARGYRWRYKNN